MIIALAVIGWLCICAFAILFIGVALATLRSELGFTGSVGLTPFIFGVLGAAFLIVAVLTFPFHVTVKQAASAVASNNPTGQTTGGES